jgi:hypothetical protein
LTNAGQALELVRLGLDIQHLRHRRRENSVTIAVTASAADLASSVQALAEHVVMMARRRLTSHASVHAGPVDQERNPHGWRFSQPLSCTLTCLVDAILPPQTELVAQLTGHDTRRRTPTRLA